MFLSFPLSDYYIYQIKECETFALTIRVKNVSEEIINSNCEKSSVFKNPLSLQIFMLVNTQTHIF